MNTLVKERTNKIADYKRLRDLSFKTDHLPMEQVRNNASLIFVDVSNVQMGRVASIVSLLLRGADRGDFSFHNRTFNYVILHGIKDVVLTGEKEDKKVLYTHSGYPGGLKTIHFKKGDARNVCYHMWRAVYGMLPKTRSRHFFTLKVRLNYEPLDITLQTEKKNFRGISYLSIPLSNVDSIKRYLNSSSFFHF